MTAPQEEEFKELEEFANEIAQGMQSDLQPRCIVRAFGRPGRSIFVLTMQVWIDLEAINSPILLGIAPEGEDAPEQLRAALAAFASEGASGWDFDPTLIEPAEAVAIVRRMLAAVSQAFTTCLGMKQPNVGLDSGSDGFGTWLPLLACLISQCGMSRQEALATPVDQAFAIIAAMRRNQGWHEAGEPYASREVIS